MKKLFLNITSSFLALLVFLSTSGFSINQMLCHKSGKKIVSISTIKNCCSKTKSCSTELNKSCCSFDKTNLSVQNFTSNASPAYTTPLVINCPPNINFLSHTQLTIANNSSLLFTVKSPPLIQEDISIKSCSLLI